MNIDDLKDVKLNDVLNVFGVQKQKDAMDVLLPAVGLFAAGMLVGAGVALMLAPSSGADLRNKLAGRVTDISDEVKNRFGTGETIGTNNENPVGV